MSAAVQISRSGFDFSNANRFVTLYVFFNESALRAAIAMLSWKAKARTCQKPQAPVQLSSAAFSKMGSYSARTRARQQALLSRIRTAKRCSRPGRAIYLSMTDGRPKT